MDGWHLNTSEGSVVKKGIGGENNWKEVEICG